MAEVFPNGFRVDRVSGSLITRYNLKTAQVPDGTPLDEAVIQVLIDAVHLAAERGEQLDIKRCAEYATRATSGAGGSAKNPARLASRRTLGHTREG